MSSLFLARRSALALGVKAEAALTHQQTTTRLAKSPRLSSDQVSLDLQLTKPHNGDLESRKTVLSHRAHERLTYDDASGSLPRLPTHSLCFKVARKADAFQLMSAFCFLTLRCSRVTTDFQPQAPATVGWNLRASRLDCEAINGTPGWFSFSSALRRPILARRQSQGQAIPAAHVAAPRSYGLQLWARAASTIRQGRCFTGSFSVIGTDLASAGSKLRPAIES